MDWSIPIDAWAEVAHLLARMIPVVGNYFNNVFHKATGMTPRNFRVSREKKDHPDGH